MTQHNKLHKGIRSLKDIALSESEKGRLLSVLGTHISTHPLPSRKSIFDRIKEHAFGYALAACSILLVIGGGVCVAAEKALPGDILYPVKIHVNEAIQESLQRTPAQKAAWEEKRVERRLGEEKQLAEKREQKPKVRDTGFGKQDEGKAKKSEVKNSEEKIKKNVEKKNEQGKKEKKEKDCLGKKC